MKTFRTRDFDFHLPESQIAKYPLKERTASRLLALDISDQRLSHHHFSDIERFIQPNDLLVLNNTKVIPARLYGEKSTGGKVECLIERILPDQRVLAHLRGSKSLKIGASLLFAEAIEATLIARHDDLVELHILNEEPILTLLEKYGHIPLPPYIDREDELLDHQRYQTVFSEKAGAVAAPTAGLHFDEALLVRLKEKGVRLATLTLHVGAGTFQPVRVDNLDEHVMHSEYMELDQACCDLIHETKKNEGRVIAVGTTAVRSLETAARDGTIKPYVGETKLFIRPGFQFHCVDAMITNFHLPESTLLMLVCAFGGYDFVMRAYEEAIREKYRFFSYGDAMLLALHTDFDHSR